jgi:hypothetical protein
MAGEADEWRQVATARPQVLHSATDYRFAGEADSRQAFANQRLAAGVVGSERAAFDQRFGQRENALAIAIRFGRGIV